MTGGELLIVLIIAVVVLVGGTQIPKIARSVGSAKSEFQKGLKEGDASLREEEDERERRRGRGFDGLDSPDRAPRNDRPGTGQSGNSPRRDS